MLKVSTFSTWVGITAGALMIHLGAYAHTDHAVAETHAAPAHHAHIKHTTQTQAATEEERVRQSMLAIWDSPESPLLVEPVIVEGDYAMAGWIQQDRGGRALLNRRQGQWQVHVCGGDGLKDLDALTMAGMQAPAAQRLIDALTAAEAKLPAATRAKFDAFGQNILVNGEHALE